MGGAEECGSKIGKQPTKSEHYDTPSLPVSEYDKVVQYDLRESSVRRVDSWPVPSPCRYCKSVHKYKGAEVRRSRPASQPNHKLGQKAKPKGFRVSTRPLSFASQKLKDPCYGRLSQAEQKQAEAAELSSALFTLEGKLRCADCGQFVGAKKRTEGGFEPDPRPHERYKEPRQRLSKRGPRK